MEKKKQSDQCLIESARMVGSGATSDRKMGGVVCVDLDCESVTDERVVLDWASFSDEVGERTCSTIRSSALFAPCTALLAYVLACFGKLADFEEDPDDCARVLGLGIRGFCSCSSISTKET